MKRRKTKDSQSLDIVITGNVAWQKDLSWLDRLLYGVIRSLTQNDYYACYASNEYFAELMGREERSIREAISTLEKQGYLYRAKGWILLDDGEMSYQRRMIVLTEFKRKFEKEQEKMLDLRAKSSKKIGIEVAKNCRHVVAKNCHLNGNIYPYEKDIINNNIKQDITPIPPYEGDTKGALTNVAEYATYGKYQNVRLTASEYGELVQDFGEPLVLSLIQQLDANIQSGVKRYRRKIVHSAKIREWALIRHQPQVVNKRALVGGCDIERRPYSADEMNALFTPIDDVAPDDAGTQ